MALQIGFNIVIQHLRVILTLYFLCSNSIYDWSSVFRINWTWILIKKRKNKNLCGSSSCKRTTLLWSSMAAVVVTVVTASVVDNRSFATFTYT
jgi:hypothetical protein